VSDSVEICFFPPVLPCQIWSFIRLSIIMEICQIILTPSAPPFKVQVFGTDVDRSTTYDFLLVFRSNYGPISYRFLDEGQLQKFSHPPSTLYI